MSENEEQAQFHADPEIAALEKKVVDLAHQNIRMSTAIKQVGVDIDLAAPRVESLLQFLQDAGIITYKQICEERLAWEQRLRAELQPVFAEVKRAIRLSGQPTQSEGGIIIPGAGTRPPKR